MLYEGIYYRPFDYSFIFESTSFHDITAIFFCKGTYMSQSKMLNSSEKFDISRELALNFARSSIINFRYHQAVKIKLQFWHIKIIYTKLSER